MKNKTMILGASAKTNRYAYQALKLLEYYGHDVIAIGNREDSVGNTPIHKGITEPLEDVDTITLYLSKKYQGKYYDDILKMKPRRLIFNPGTENDDLEQLALDHGIEAIHGCTLVMLNTRQY